MKVTLIYHTPDAIDILIFTKNTRLNMSPNGLDDIRSWPVERKMQELNYMSRTLPSSWEFVDLIFCIEEVTRAFTHQLVRTRTASYAQQAMRVVDMTGFGYEVGPSIKNNEDAASAYKAGMEEINDTYQDLIKLGAQPEDARGILPTNVHTNICAKYNLRTFADLVIKRSDTRVQHEYGEVLKLMIKAVLDVWPWASLFMLPRAPEAYNKISAYLREQMQKEINEGEAMTTTKAWAMMKELTILRDKS